MFLQQVPLVHGLRFLLPPELKEILPSLFQTSGEDSTQTIAMNSRKGFVHQLFCSNLIRMTTSNMDSVAVRMILQMTEFLTVVRHCVIVWNPLRLLSMIGIKTKTKELRKPTMKAAIGIKARTLICY